MDKVEQGIQWLIYSQRAWNCWNLGRTPSTVAPVASSKKKKEREREVVIMTLFDCLAPKFVGTTHNASYSIFRVQHKFDNYHIAERTAIAIAVFRLRPFGKNSNFSKPACRILMKFCMYLPMTIKFARSEQNYWKDFVQPIHTCAQCK